MATAPSAVMYANESQDSCLARLASRSHSSRPAGEALADRGGAEGSGASVVSLRG
jgi:hypothetical protein